MQLIYKYVVSAFSAIGEEHTVSMHPRAEVLDVGFQDDKLVAWAAVEPDVDEPPSTARFFISFTGAPTPSGAFRHIRTLQRAGYVFHVFMAE